MRRQLLGLRGLRGILTAETAVSSGRSRIEGTLRALQKEIPVVRCTLHRPVVFLFNRVRRQNLFWLRLLDLIFLTSPSICLDHRCKAWS